jgi:scyllo-inositol 2-dehydrogenase (NADP+)
MKKRFRKMSDIKVGAVGYGASFMIARQHLSEMKCAGMQVVCVADIDPPRLPAARQDFPGIATYSSATEMLAKCDVDLLCICTPHNTHADLAIECMEAGRNVVTEKPFAITTEECDRMIAVRDANKVMLSTYHNRHWDGWIMEAVRKIRQEKLIGDVVRVEAHMGGYSAPGAWWRSSKSISGGVMYDWGVHLLEYSLQLLDGNMTEVSGYAHRGFWADKNPYGLEDGIEDEAFGVVRFDSGQRLTLLTSNLESAPREGWLTVTGTKGVFIIRPGRWKAICQEKDCKVIREGNDPPSESYRFYENIGAHLTKGEPLVITAEFARRPIHILDLICKSSMANRAMQTIYG